MAAETAPVSSPPASAPFSQIIDGLQFPKRFSADCIRSALGYRPRRDDIILSTYPKCGTTWTQTILALILRQGEPFDQMKIHSFSPFLEMAGTEVLESMPRPGVIKTHLPFHLAPWSDEAKYIYVTRNPMDCCVSYFHHKKRVQGKASDFTFDNFFETFISGKIDYGDYFDHLLGWYAHRNDPNVLLMTYEDMKEDAAAAVLKLAAFVDDASCARPLRDHPQKLRDVLKYSSFEHMREAVNKSMGRLIGMGEEEIRKSGLPRGLEHLLLNSHDKNESAGQEAAECEYIRKGIVGDWRNHLTAEQHGRLREKFEERTRGTDIPKLFEKYMV